MTSQEHVNTEMVHYSKSTHSVCLYFYMCSDRTFLFRDTGGDILSDSDLPEFQESSDETHSKQQSLSNNVLFSCFSCI